ncbi:MAG: response regulator [Nitrososphaera sp.]
MSDQPRIMVVEDDQDILTLVIRHLLANHFDAVGFSDPLKALADFKSDPAKYDVLLTDIRMPGMNGIELAAHVTRLNPMTKIMIMTAHELFPEDLRLRLPIISHRDILRKPFQLAEVCNRLRKLVDAN